MFSLDHNNLYGSAQMMKLPKYNFRWANELQKRAIGIYLESLKLYFKAKSFKEENSPVENILNEKNIGFFDEEDLKYPSKLHNSHSDFPLLPRKNGAENLKIT